MLRQPAPDAGDFPELETKLARLGHNLAILRPARANLGLNFIRQASNRGMLLAAKGPSPAGLSDWPAPILRTTDFDNGRIDIVDQ